MPDITVNTSDGNSAYGQLGFAFFSIAIIAFLVVAMGRQGAWVLLLLVLAMVVRSQI